MTEPNEQQVREARELLRVGPSWSPTTINAVARLLARIAELEVALQPFANSFDDCEAYAAQYGRLPEDDMDLDPTFYLKVKHLRTARATLAKGSPNAG